MSQRRHEHRVVALLQTLLGPDALRSEMAVPRIAHSVDALVRLDEPADPIGPLGELVAHRTLVIEHESRAPGLLQFYTALGKLAWVIRAPWIEEKGHDRRPPLLLFLTSRRPRWITSGALGFVPHRFPGVYRLAWPLPPEVVLVHLRGLPDEPGLSLLRLMPTPRDAAEAEAGILRLKADPGVLESSKERVLEAIMNHQIPTTDQERRLTVEGLLRKGRREALLDLARRLLSPDQLARLETLDDPDALDRQLIALLGRQ